VPASERAAWRQRLGLAADGRPVVVLAPGAVGPSKRWPVASYADLAHRLAAEGHWIWVVGGPGEKELAGEIADGADIRHLTRPGARERLPPARGGTRLGTDGCGSAPGGAAARPPRQRIFGPDQRRALGPAHPDHRRDRDRGRTALPAMS